MFNFIKNKFAFIIGISLLTLLLLVIGAVVLYQDNSKIFETEGYIISTNSKNNIKYYFSPNTKYKDSVDNNVVFKDTDSKSVSVSNENFVHYQNGSIGFLTRGAILNLSEINSAAMNYYNVNDDDIITYRNNNYIVESNKGTVNIETFIGRISDNKYIVAGKDLSLKIPNNSEKITGDYFEILFIENGIVKIDNQEVSYQVTAQDTSISVGNNIMLDLGTGKIYYNGEAKMLMSQLTINGNENIDIDTVEKEKEDEAGSASGENSNENKDNNIVQDNQENEPTTDDDKQDSNKDKKNNTSSGTTNTALIELIEANVSSTAINLSFQLNNASAIKGKLQATLTNVNNNKKEIDRTIEARNGTFKLNKESLLPNTEYTLTITETTDKSEKQYFQKTFKTSELGITLEKEYATSDSLAYTIIFDENSEVEKVKLTLFDSDGAKVNEGFTISSKDISKTREFTSLISNSNYSAKVESIWIRSIEYSDIYTINRIDTTLKIKPTLSNIQVKANKEEIKFNIKVNEINDPDKGIESFKYYIYKADDITLDNPKPTPVYIANKNDADELVLNLNEIEELKTGIDYRCKVVALYDDNVMIRESESDYSANFLIKSKPSFSWETTSTTINKVEGNLKILDGNCSVPMSGRECLNKPNSFTIKYYKIGEDDSKAKEKSANFDVETLTSEVTFSELSSDTTYVVKLYGNYIDDDGVEHVNVQLGDVAYIKTDASENLKFKVIKDNPSGIENGVENLKTGPVVTFDAKLDAPEDSNLKNEISSITLNLYSGSYNIASKLIGTYVMDDTNTIKDFFDNYTITNKLFKNKSLGPIDDVEKLIRLTNNLTGTLNSTYTVEIASVLDSAGVNEIYVEDNVYTFKLTPSYYLDSRIDTNSSYKYITVTQIKKSDLSEEEYNELKRNVNNLDELNDDTIVAINIENNLSDAFVDSAFSYEKVTIDYVVYNKITNNEIKRINVDKGNKYQPSSKLIYLDGTDDNGSTKFTRGYDYRVSYELKFTTEKGDNPTYKNENLQEDISIKRQSAIYSQYISTSTNDSITYRYSINDLDKALSDKYLYYDYKEEAEKNASETELVIDGEYHDITLPINENKEYSVYFKEKGTNGNDTYKQITQYNFEKEFNYNNQNSFQIVNENDNLLKIKILENEITKRAAAYKLTIKDKSGSKPDYTRFFLASKLTTKNIETSELDEEGNPITSEEKYITLDYANINEYMKKDLEISIACYYDSGLVGINQTFTNGMILYNGNNYLNIYNKGSNTATDSEEKILNGVYMLRENYEKDGTTMSLYNYLQDTNNYNPLSGSTYYLTDELNRNIGINYQLTFANTGVIFKNGRKEFAGYNSKVVKVANLKTENNNYRFNSITPKVSIESNNTINSLKIKVNSTGVYGQFTKDGIEHNVFYIDIYKSSELTSENHLKTLTSNITITNKNAESEEVELKDLNPDTTYYVTVSAYVEGVLTRLYDTNSTNGYVVKTYESKTLNANEILEKITFSVNPIEYNNESSNKKLKWKLNLKNTENYKIRFELFDIEGNAVKFDGTNGTSCNKETLGTEENSYIANCYIQISKDEIEAINKKDIEYVFTGDSFVFGGKYYKLYLYAIPYKNNSYDETNKVTLYENESLTTTGDIEVTGKPNYDITIPKLDEAVFSLNDTLISGTRCITKKDTEGNTLYNGNSPICDETADSNKVEYFIELIPSVNDKSYVIKYGTYTVSLKNAANEIKSTKTGISASSIGKRLTFTGLDANALYYVELNYETYRNNVGFSESQKIATVPFTDFIYTPIDAGITLGTITAAQNTNQKILLTYNGAYNMINNIKKVKYTISLKGGSSNASGTYEITSGDSNIFVVSSDKTPKLTIDLSTSSDENFTLKSGNTYIITTEYWYKNEHNEYVQLKDHNTENDKFTTILNL